MPELPEVETIVRKLNAGQPVEKDYPACPPLPGGTIVAARADWPPQIYPSVRALKRRLPGHCIESVTRRGKYVVLELRDSQAATPSRSQRAARNPLHFVSPVLRPGAARAGGQLATNNQQPATSNEQPAVYLLIHLKMSGRLAVLPADWPANKHDRVVLALDNGCQLRFNDARKFGRVYLVDDAQDILGRLGPEPLDEAFTLKAFRARLAGRSGALKPLLLDQAFIAGVGNIYADEALWRARLHPQRKAASLAPDEVGRLYRAIRAALREGIARGGSAIDWVYPEGAYQDYFRVYGRSGQACRRCGTPVERIVVGQRGTHFCPCCQV